MLIDTFLFWILVTITIALVIVAAGLIKSDLEFTVPIGVVLGVCMIIMWGAVANYPWYHQRVMAHPVIIHTDSFGGSCITNGAEFKRYTKADEPQWYEWMKNRTNALWTYKEGQNLYGNWMVIGQSKLIDAGTITNKLEIEL